MRNTKITLFVKKPVFLKGNRKSLQKKILQPTFHRKVRIDFSAFLTIFNFAGSHEKTTFGFTHVSDV